MQIFDPFHRFVIFKIDLSHFLLYMIALFLLQIMFQRMIMIVLVTFNLAFCLLFISFACWQKPFVAFERMFIINQKKLTKKCMNKKFYTTVQHVIFSFFNQFYMLFNGNFAFFQFFVNLPYYSMGILHFLSILHVIQWEFDIFFFFLNFPC